MIGLTDETLHKIIDHRQLVKCACIKRSALRTWIANVRAWMLACNVKQKDLAARCKMSPVWLCYVLAGTRKPTIGSMLRIAAALAVEPVDDLWMPHEEFLRKHCWRRTP